MTTLHVVTGKNPPPGPPKGDQWKLMFGDEKLFLLFQDRPAEMSGSLEQGARSVGHPGMLSSSGEQACVLYSGERAGGISNRIVYQHGRQIS